MSVQITAVLFILNKNKNEEYRSEQRLFRCFKLEKKKTEKRLSFKFNSKFLTFSATFPQQYPSSESNLLDFTKIIW